MKKFFNYFLKALAFILASWVMGRLFPACLGIVDVNAAANNITGGMNYFTYNTTESSTVKNGNKSFATSGSTVVYPFSAYTNNNFAFGYKSLQFVTSSPSGSKSAIGYTITTTFQLLFDGLNNNMGNTSYTGWVKFNEGTITNQVDSVKLIALTSGSATFKLTTTAQLSSTTTLNNITVDLTAANSLGYAGYGDKFTVQLVLKDISVQYATDTSSAILNSLNQNQQQTNQKLDEVKEETKKHTEEQKKTNEKLDKAEETRQGIWETIKGLPGKFLDMLKGLFIPDDFDFINDFKEVLENKLGFIAEVPLAVIDFILGLATASWDDFNSITLPTIDIFGVNFWNSQEISLQSAIDIFSPYKYITDVICVALCVNTLKKWYDKFASGGGES